MGDPAPGSFGRFEILAEIGRGGMGVVYRAREPGLDREVALKTLLTGDFSGSDDVERFLGEAKTLARLKHPGIVPLFDWGRVDNHVFFTMPFLEGVPLNELLEGYTEGGKPSTTLHEMVSEARRKKSAPRAKTTPGPPRRPIPVVHAVTLARKILEPLGYAHERGVIHRDLKPSNVMVTDDGDVVLMDFGLARARGGSSKALTLSGTILGTPAYMAPEQARGDSKLADERSDLYAVGAMLYEMLAGRPVFELTSDPYRDLQRVIDESPASLCRLQPSVPKDLETVVHKALEKEPSRRYPSATAMAEDLRRVLANEPIQARPPSLAYRARKWMLRHRAVSAAAFVALLAGGIVMGTAAWRSARQRAERRAAIRRAGDLLAEPLDSAGLDRALQEARVAVGDGRDPESRELLRRIFIASAERWIRLDRHEIALGTLEEARTLFPRDARIEELYRIAEGSGLLSIDTTPSGAEVLLWRQDDLEAAVDDALEERDRLELDRRRRIFEKMEWRTVGLYDFRPGKPPGVEVRFGNPVFKGGLRPGRGEAVALLPGATRGPTRLTLRGRVESTEGWSLSAWWSGQDWAPRWFSRYEGRVISGPTTTAELSWEDFRLGRADCRPGADFEIVFEWALDSGRVLVGGKVVLEISTDEESEPGAGTGLTALGAGLVVEEVRVEGSTAPTVDRVPPPEARSVGPTRIGVTPLKDQPLKMGSYILELRSADRIVRYPVFISRNRHWQAGTVRLDHDVPESCVYVPAGPAIVGGRELTLPAFAISRTEVTKHEFWEFLQSLPDGERKRLTPSMWTPTDEGGRQGAEDWGYGPYDPIRHAEQDLEPVGFVRVEAAARYCEWLSAKTGRRFRLPTGEEWEKAARGVDGREFPWGRRFHRRRAKLDCVPSRLAPVTSFPLGASPYGALHMSGNIAEWTRTLFRGEVWRNVVKGGSYLAMPDEARCAAEEGRSNAGSWEDVGFRVLLDLSDR